MARGGSGPGGHNNALTATTATTSDIQRLTRQALDTFLLSQHNTVDLHNEESVYHAIVDYFEQCEKNATRPGNLGLYAALGMSKQDYNNVTTGKSKSKASPACIDLMKKAVQAIGAFREGLALEGKINPVTYIFMGKNYDGLTDTTNITVSTDQGPQAQLSPEQIAKQIEKDIPVDVEYKQVEE